MAAELIADTDMRIVVVRDAEDARHGTDLGIRSVT
jgi:hypothetical protein